MELHYTAKIGYNNRECEIIFRHCLRELRNVIERAVALTQYEKITVEDLPEKIRAYHTPHIFLKEGDPKELLPLKEVEQRYILHVLDTVGGNRTTASQILGIDRKTLYRKIQSYENTQ